MEKNQTAVEWLLEKMQTEWGIAISDNVTEQAKEMEKKQITHAMNKGFNEGYEHGKESDNERLNTQRQSGGVGR